MADIHDGRNCRPAVLTGIPVGRPGHRRFLRPRHVDPAGMVTGTGPGVDGEPLLVGVDPVARLPGAAVDRAWLAPGNSAVRRRDDLDVEAESFGRLGSGDERCVYAVVRAEG